MAYPEAFTGKTRAAQAHALVTSLAVALAGVIVFPVGYAFEASAGLPPSTEQELRVGHSSGWVQKIDMERGAVTLKHGPIASLGMPDMTMIFRVANLGQLTGLNVGDQVRFQVQSVKGVMMISEIESAR